MHASNQHGKVQWMCVTDILLPYSFHHAPIFSPRANRVLSFLPTECLQERWRHDQQIPNSLQSHSTGRHHRRVGRDYHRCCRQRGCIEAHHLENVPRSSPVTPRGSLEKMSVTPPQWGRRAPVCGFTLFFFWVSNCVHLKLLIPLRLGSINPSIHP